MSQKLPPQIARIYSTNNQVIGGGVLVSHQHVITCAHVIASALGKPEAVQEQPIESVELDFPGCPSIKKRVAKIRQWKPVKSDLSALTDNIEDIAVLELEEPVPRDIHPANFTQSYSNQRFTVCGFPEPQGKWSFGRISGPQANGWLQVQGEESTGTPIQKGFSGSPVWDQELNLVFGIVVTANLEHPQYKDASIIPTAALHDIYDSLIIHSESASQSTKNSLFLQSMGAGAAIGIAVILFRVVGFLEPLEFWAFDQFLKFRPAEPIDQRLLIIGITASDIHAQDNRGESSAGGWSLRDASLNQLLSKLDQYTPSVIGLDMQRNFVAKVEGLDERMRQNSRLVTICELPNINDQEDSASDFIPGTGFAPFPNAPSDRIGFVDTLTDGSEESVNQKSGVVRRHYLYAETPPQQQPCPTQQSFSLALALRFLERQPGQVTQLIAPNVSQNHLLQIKYGTQNIIFKDLENFAGGYQGLNPSGYQLLLNYRSPGFFPGNLSSTFRIVSLEMFLKGEVDPNWINDRIVLIGVVSKEYSNDFWETPYGSAPGVIIHAHKVSQIINAAVMHRPLLTYWSRWWDGLWILGWALVGSTPMFVSRRFPQLDSRIITSVGGLCLCLICFVGLLQFSLWVPFIPALLCWVGSSIFAKRLGAWCGNRRTRMNNSRHLRQTYPTNRRL